MKGDRKFAPLFEVRWIDAWADGEGGWEWNESRKLFEFRSEALNLKRTFTNRLRTFIRKSPFFKGELGRGWYYVTNDWDVMELCRRCDGCPFYACIRITP